MVTLQWFRRAPGWWSLSENGQKAGGIVAFRYMDGPASMRAEYCRDRRVLAFAHGRTVQSARRRLEHALRRRSLELWGDDDLRFSETDTPPA